VKTVSTASRQLPSAGIRARLLNRGAYQWYLGTIFGLAYQASEIVYVWTSHGSLGFKLVATVLLAIFYLAYVVLPPLIWPHTVRTRFIAILIYWAATFVLLPFIGPFLIWVWPLVVAMLAFSWLPVGPSLAITAVMAGLQVLLASSVKFDEGTGFAPFVLITVAISLFSITRQIAVNRKLRDAQATIATLAAAEERARLARDLHDVLGHSLTVVAVKSELAGRLVEQDPKRAIAEIADIEKLSRTALADLRAAVSSYREMNLDSELSAARTALEAAGIAADFPLDGDVVDEDLRPLFGWVLREGVTNVIRHSQATRCWVDLERRRLSVRDDGAGGITSGEAVARKAGGHPGNGLRGLAERATEVGAQLSASRVDDGFLLTVAKATR